MAVSCGSWTPLNIYHVRPVRRARVLWARVRAVQLPHGFVYTGSRPVHSAKGGAARMQLRREGETWLRRSSI